MFFCFCFSFSLPVGCQKYMHPNLYGKKYWLVWRKGLSRSKWFRHRLQICVFSGLVIGWWLKLRAAHQYPTQSWVPPPPAVCSTFDPKLGRLANEWVTFPWKIGICMGLLSKSAAARLYHYQTWTPPGLTTIQSRMIGLTFIILYYNSYWKCGHFTKLIWFTTYYSS